MTGYTPVQISRIRRRFAEEGLAGLNDQPRSGRPPRLTEAKSARIVALTLKTPPKGLTHWSTRELADGSGCRTPRCIGSGRRTRCNRTGSRPSSSAPIREAEDKIRDVVGLYLNPADQRRRAEPGREDPDPGAGTHPADAAAAAESAGAPDPRLPAPRADQPVRGPGGRLRARSSANAPRDTPAPTSCASSRSCIGAIAGASCM